MFSSMTLPVLFLAAVAVGSTAVALALASRRRIHRAVLALVALFVTLGGLAGAVPGGVVLLGAVVVAATGPSHGTPWGLLTAFMFGGGLLGITAGAAGAAKIAEKHVKRPGMRAACTALFALGGILLTWGVAAATQVQDDRFLVLVALTWLTTALVGFVLPR